MKTCKNPACENENPQPLDNFIKSSRHKDGRLPKCKQCDNRERFGRRQGRAKEKCSFKSCTNGMSFKKTGLCWGHQRQLSQGLELKPILPKQRNSRRVRGTEKQCNTCDRWLPVDEYAPTKGLSLGVSNTCRRCHACWKYRITSIEYQAMLEQQDGKCAICRMDDGTVLYVDHDHSCCPGSRSCGQCIRGLLCHGCNRGLGSFKDSTISLENAIKYLERNKHDRL